MHEHWNDVPGDIAGEDSPGNLPGSFGIDDPDRDVDATLEDFFPHRILHGTDRITSAAQGNDTVEPDTVGEGEGATVSERDLASEDERSSAAGLIPEGGEDSDVETEQQHRNRSTESQG